MLSRFARLSLLLAFCVFAPALPTTAAEAQDGGTPPASERPPYKSAKGYSILPPAGWEVISGELDDQEFKKLPPEIQNNYNPKSADVLFMDLSGATGDKGDKKAFRDCMNVAVIEEAVPINDELSKELEKILGEQYGSLLKNFQVSAFETRKFGTNQAIHLRATYEAVDYKLFMYQALVTGPDKTLVLTCTVDETRKTDRMKQCEEAFSTLSFATAAPPPP